MGVYHFLINKTKKERIEFDGYIKYGPIRYNDAVHSAFVNYMFEHQGDDFTILNDCGDEVYSDDLTEVDLRKYQFNDAEVNADILKKINEVENKTAPQKAVESAGEQQTTALCRAEEPPQICEAQTSA